MVTALDIVVYAVAVVLVGGVFWWVLRRWVPDGALSAHVYHAYQSGVSRRQTLPAAAVALVALAPVVTKGPDSVGHGWAVVAGIFADGETLATPVTGRDAVCYTASIAQYKEQPLRSYGTYFTTDFAIERTPFAIEGDDGTASVDPEGAWLSLAAGSPTDTEIVPEGTTTGGPAEHELVVEEGNQYRSISAATARRFRTSR
jgi:hypothetical protein